jgi:hypothetical protein
MLLYFYFNDKQNEVPSLSIFTVFGHEIIKDNEYPTDGRICESWFYIAVNNPSRFFRFKYCNYYFYALT